MEIINLINPIIASLENTLGECVTALNEGRIDVQMVANTIGTVQQALSKLRPVICQLVKLEDEQSTRLCCINDLVCELYFSLDETGQHYEPRPHAENVELIHDLLNCLDWSDLESEQDNAVNFPSKKELPQAFSEAMHTHIALVEQHGENSPQAKRSFMVAMQLAPDWFKDDIAKMSDEMDLLPPASGYLEDGSPMFSLEDIAEKFGISLEQAKQDFEEMLSVRTELGLSNDGVLADPTKNHWRQ